MISLKIAKNLSLPEDTITSTMIIYGSKGMGKTNLLSVMCEELAKKRLKFSVMDPMGVCWGLQHGADKSGKGIDVLILGGIHGDIPIDPTAGAIVADLVVDETVSTVIDISRHANGKMWGRGERIRFVADYCTRLYERQGESRVPLLQFFDEAAGFVPQLIPHGAVDVARCSGAIMQLCEEGRNIGVGLAFFTLRSARLNKSVAELADCMFSFRTVGPNSIKAILEWLGEHVDKSRWNDLLAKIRSLPIGQALVVSPGWLQYEGIAQIRPRETFDSSATPKPGKPLRAPGKATKPDLTKYRERMKATIEKASADDPRALRAKVQELERKLKAAPAASKWELKEVRVEVPVLKAEQVKRLEKATAKVSDVLSRAILTVHESAQLVDNLKLIASEIAAAAKFPKGTFDASLLKSLKLPEVSITPKQPSLHTSAPVKIQKKDSHVSIGYLPGGERKILTALAQYPEGRTKVQVAILTGYAHSGGGFGNYLGSLRSKGFVAGSQDHLRITEEGAAVLGDFTPLPTGTALLEHWRRQLGKAERAALDVLAKAYPGSVGKETLAELAGYNAGGGGFGNALSRLRTLELIQGRGELKASDALFD
jgi:hypothetical protein